MSCLPVPMRDPTVLGSPTANDPEVDLVDLEMTRTTQPNDVSLSELPIPLDKLVVGLCSGTADEVPGKHLLAALVVTLDIGG